MKLIDVNEAIAQIIEDKIPENYMPIMRATGSGLQAETLNQACDRHIKILDELQAVDAIPVEWIKKWLNNIANNERYKNEYVELTEEVKRIVYRQAMIIKIPCISDMLEDWEKENEMR